jgi:serine protease Do
MRGEGSGFVISADGYILTNAHVVDDATEVTVRTTDRREYRAKVVGIDTRTDVALLKIDAKNLPVVQVGDPHGLKAGEWVIAIGSPFGYENSVTAGIVSATARSLGDTYTPFIQTDVAVNPGNPAAPVQPEGRVVGINSQIYSRTGGYQSVSFAIPIDVAMNVKNQLVATGHASAAASA